jgi:RNA polymerase sigma-70 factor (ECF subfamily)
MTERLTERGGAARDMILVIEPLVPGLRRLASALVEDASAADDVVQDCLERAVSRWHQRNTDGSAKAWLFAILVNLVRDRRRGNNRRGLHMDIAELPLETFSEDPVQEVGLSTDDVFRAIDMLSEGQRDVLLLVSVEDLSYVETAETLGVPIGTVMSRLARGRERLRRILDGEAIAPTQLRRVK